MRTRQGKKSPAKKLLKKYNKIKKTGNVALMNRVYSEYLNLLRRK